MTIKTLLLTVIFLTAYRNSLKCQTDSCVGVDTAAIANQAYFTISKTAQINRIRNSDNIWLYHDKKKRRFKVVCGRGLKKIIFTFRYSLRPPDFYYNYGCYLLVEPITAKLEGHSQSLKGFTQHRPAPDSILLQTQEQKYDRAFNELYKIWNIHLPKLPCGMWVEFVATMPVRYRTPIEFNLVFYSCLVIKTELKKNY